MTAAGQAMCVLVPIRQAPAFRNVDEIDAKHMGLEEDEKTRFEEPAAEAKKWTELKKSEVADFRAERQEVRKAVAAERKARVSGASGLLLKPPRADKKALPSFLKVRGAQADEDAPAPPQKRPRLDFEEKADESSSDGELDAPGAAGSAGGMGLGGYASDEDEDAEDGA